MSGHLSEEEAVSLADAQPVPASVASHAETCEACAERVADHALLSLSVQLDIRALASTAPQQLSPGAARDTRRGIPVGEDVRDAARPALQLPSSRKPLIVGLLVAIAASVPALPSVAREAAWLSGSRHFSGEAMRQLAGALHNLASGPVWSVAATLGLLGVGVLVASHATRLENDSTEGRSTSKIPRALGK